MILVNGHQSLLVYYCMNICWLWHFKWLFYQISALNMFFVTFVLLRSPIAQEAYWWAVTFCEFDDCVTLVLMRIKLIDRPSHIVICYFRDLCANAHYAYWRAVTYCYFRDACAFAITHCTTSLLMGRHFCLNLCEAALCIGSLIFLHRGQ